MIILSACNAEHVGWKSSSLSLSLSLCLSLSLSLSRLLYFSFFSLSLYIYTYLFFSLLLFCFSLSLSIPSHSRYLSFPVENNQRSTSAEQECMKLSQARPASCEISLSCILRTIRELYSDNHSQPHSDKEIRLGRALRPLPSLMGTHEGIHLKKALSQAQLGTPENTPLHGTKPLPNTASCSLCAATKKTSGKTLTSECDPRPQREK